MRAQQTPHSQEAALERGHALAAASAATAQETVVQQQQQPVAEPMQQTTAETQIDTSTQAEGYPPLGAEQP